jgi:hypothetical protein
MLPINTLRSGRGSFSVNSNSWIEPFCGDMQKPPYWFVIGAEPFCNPGEDRGMDLGCFWKASVRSEEKPQRGEGKSIRPAFASDEGVILWRKRPCVDRIFGTVSLLSHGPLIEGSPPIAR